MQPGLDCLALELQPDDFPTFRLSARIETLADGFAAAAGTDAVRTAV
jgi:hypothetical protein